MNKIFSVIITTKNEELIIERVIDSILKQKYSRNLYEIICVDDGSSDDTIKILNNLEVDIVIINDINKGISHSKNIGIERASGEYLFFVDAQMILLNDNYFCLAEDIFKSNNDIAGICGKYQSPYSGDYNIIRDIRREEVFGKQNKSLIIDKSNFTSFSGGFSFFRREVFKNFYFNEDFNNSTGEDLFLIVSIINAGYKFLYEPEIISDHYHYLDLKKFAKKISLELRLVKNTIISNSNNKEFIIIPYLDLCYSFPLFFILSLIIFYFLGIPLLFSFLFLIPEFIFSMRCFKCKKELKLWGFLAFILLFLKEVFSSFYTSIALIFNIKKIKIFKTLKNFVYWEIDKWRHLFNG